MEAAAAVIAGDRSAARAGRCSHCAENDVGPIALLSVALAVLALVGYGIDADLRVVAAQRARDLVPIATAYAPARNSR